MARKRKQKQTEGGVTCRQCLSCTLEFILNWRTETAAIWLFSSGRHCRPGLGCDCAPRTCGCVAANSHAMPLADPDAAPVLVTRTKTMKVAVTFQSNGMLAPPPKSSLARGNQGAKGAAVSAAQSHQMVEVLETDNPMADLLKLLGGSQPPSGPAVVPTASAAMPAGITSVSSTVAAPPAPPMSNPPPMSGDFDVLVDNVSGGGDLFAAPAPAPASLFDMLEMPVASGHAATNTNTLAAPVMQPIVSTAAQQRSLQEIQAAQNAARSQLQQTSSNPFGSNPQPQPQWGRSI